ncbi:MAG: ATP-binding protein [bacterium]
MIPRIRHLETARGLLERHPVVAIIGARQVGKTTLAQALAAGEDGVTTFDLEDPTDQARLADPMLALRPLSGLVVLDEIQRQPDLFRVLRVLADQSEKDHQKRRFLILGSASPELLRQTSESLAGRIVYHELPGFRVEEVGAERADTLWLRGSFPRSFLAEGDGASAEWRRAFIQTFLQRDLPQLGVNIASATMGRFWTMLAHYHGQLWNASDLARAFGVSDTTVKRYLDLLTSTFVVRQLQPWHENLKKRQVKSPKVYLSDSGLLHSLLNLDTARDLEGHPKVGASWEGFAMAEVIARLGARPDECFFWATHAGAELDLLVTHGRRRLGFEFKRTSAPKTTRSMHHALRDLKLDRLDVVHPGATTFPLADDIRALSFSRLHEDLDPLA